MLRDRLLGSVFTKTIRDWLLWTVIAVVAMWLISALYIGIMASTGDAYVTMLEDFPEVIANIYGSNGSTAQGLAMSGIYNLIGPMVLLTYAIGLGASAAVGEEEARSLPILLSSPLRRRSILLAKAAVAAIGVLVIVALTWASVVLIAALVDLDLSDQNVPAASVQLLGMVLALRRTVPRIERLARLLGDRGRGGSRSGAGVVLRDHHAAGRGGAGRPGQADPLVPVQRGRVAEPGHRRRPARHLHRPGSHAVRRRPLRARTSRPEGIAT